MIELAEWGVFALLIYLALGLVFAVWFVTRRVQLDPAAREAGWGFRLLILPGCVALWPILLRYRGPEGHA